MVYDELLRVISVISFAVNSADKLIQQLARIIPMHVGPVLGSLIHQNRSGDLRRHCSAAWNKEHANKWYGMTRQVLQAPKLLAWLRRNRPVHCLCEPACMGTYVHQGAKKVGQNTDISDNRWRYISSWTEQKTFIYSGASLEKPWSQT